MSIIKCPVNQKIKVPYLEWVVLVNVRSSMDEARGTLGDSDRLLGCSTILKSNLCHKFACRKRNH